MNLIPPSSSPQESLSPQTTLSPATTNSGATPSGNLEGISITPEQSSNSSSHFTPITNHPALESSSASSSDSPIIRVEGQTPARNPSSALRRASAEIAPQAVAAPAASLPATAPAPLQAVAAPRSTQAEESIQSLAQENAPSSVEATTPQEEETIINPLENIALIRQHSLDVFENWRRALAESRALVNNAQALLEEGDHQLERRPRLYRALTTEEEASELDLINHLRTLRRELLQVNHQIRLARIDFQQAMISLTDSNQAPPQEITNNYPQVYGQFRSLGQIIPPLQRSLARCINQLSTQHSEGISDVEDNDE